MMTLCGVAYPLVPPVWPILAFAGIAYLLPLMIPWRAGSVGVLGCLFVLALWVVASTFLDRREDICDPPYFRDSVLDVAVATLWAVIVAACVMVRAPRDWRAITGLFPVAMLPAVAMAAL